MATQSDDNSNEIELFEEPTNFIRYRELYLQRKEELKPINKRTRELKKELKEKEKEHNEVIHRYPALDDPETRLKTLRDSQLGVLLDKFDAKLRPRHPGQGLEFMKKPYFLKLSKKEIPIQKNVNWAPVKWIPLGEEHLYNPENSEEKTYPPRNLEEEILIKGNIEDLFDSKGFLTKDVPYELWLFDYREVPGMHGYGRAGKGSMVFFSPEGQWCHEGTIPREKFNENDIGSVVKGLRTIVKEEYNGTLYYGILISYDYIKNMRDWQKLESVAEIDEKYHKRGDE
jgi:hypothetical protein